MSAEELRVAIRIGAKMGSLDVTKEQVKIMAEAIISAAEEDDVSSGRPSSKPAMPQSVIPHSPSIVPDRAEDEYAAPATSSLIVNPSDPGAWDSPSPTTRAVKPFRASRPAVVTKPGEIYNPDPDPHFQFDELLSVVKTAPEKVEFVAVGREDPIVLTRNILPQQALGIVKLSYSHSGSGSGMDLFKTFSTMSAEADIPAAVEEIINAGKVRWRVGPGRIESSTPTVTGGQLQIPRHANAQVSKDIK